jgi:hypothetical protein
MSGRAPRVLSALVLGLVAAGSVAAQQIWFAPPDDLPRGSKVINHDFPQLFTEPRSWRTNVDVFHLAPRYALVGSEESLRRISAYLAQHHIALAVGIGAAQMDNLGPTEGECGFGVEGYARPKGNMQIFARLKRFGVDVQYVVMDEPLTFGHYYSGKNACHFSIEDTARRAAASIAEIKQSYPDVKVVDSEASTITPANQWNTDLPQWLSAYSRAAGTPLDSLVLDVDWKKPWLDWAKPSVNAAHSQKVRVGIYLNGSGPGASDHDWIESAKQNIRSVDAAKLPFDFVMVANWTIHPSRNLPESDPETLTSLLVWYTQQHGR